MQWLNGQKLMAIILGDFNGIPTPPVVEQYRITDSSELRVIDTGDPRITD